MRFTPTHVINFNDEVLLVQMDDSSPVGYISYWTKEEIADNDTWARFQTDRAGTTLSFGHKIFDCKITKFDEIKRINENEAVEALCKFLKNGAGLDELAFLMSKYIEDNPVIVWDENDSELYFEGDEIKRD